MLSFSRCFDHHGCLASARRSIILKSNHTNHFLIVVQYTSGTFLPGPPGIILLPHQNLPTIKPTLLHPRASIHRPLNHDLPLALSTTFLLIPNQCLLLAGELDAHRAWTVVVVDGGEVLALLRRVAGVGYEFLAVAGFARVGGDGPAGSGVEGGGRGGGEGGDGGGEEEEGEEGEGVEHGDGLERDEVGCLVWTGVRVFLLEV